MRIDQYLMSLLLILPLSSDEQNVIMTLICVQIERRLVLVLYLEQGPLMACMLSSI